MFDLVESRRSAHRLGIVTDGVTYKQVKKKSNAEPLSRSRAKSSPSQDAKQERIIRFERGHSGQG